jgi:SP family arabinose:H+ symporter-like MFS transporter
VAPDHANDADWRIILGLGAVPALVAVVLRSRMPESPRWLMSKGRYDDTKKALGLLGIEVTEDDVRRTADQIAELEGKKETTSSQWTKGVKRALAVVCGFFVFQQITGINVPFYYGPRLLSDFFDGASNSDVETAMAGLQAAAILGAVNVVATYFGFRYIDRVGRRKLALGGFAGMGVFMLVAAIATASLTGTPKTVMVMVGFSLFITSFAIGVGGTGWLIQGEVFPTSVRGRAAAIAASVNWLANFALIVSYPTLNSTFGLAWVMGLFVVLAILAMVFVWRFLPETKNLSVEEVVAVFERQASGTRANALEP